MIPSAELNAVLPGARGRPRARLRRSTTRLASSERGARDLAGRRRGSPRRVASRTSRIRTGRGVNAGDARAARRPSRASRSSTRAASSSSAEGSPRVHWDELLDARPRVLRDRERRQPPPGLRLRPRLDLGPGRATVAGRARRAPHRLRSTARRGPTHHDRRRGRRLGRGPRAIRAARVRVVFGVSSGAAVNAGRLGYRYGGEILASEHRRAHHRARGSTLPERPVCAGRGRRTSAAAGPGRTHCGPGAWREAARAELAARVRPARDRRRDRRRRDRERGCAHGPRGRARRSRRLRRRHLERVVEADPRRPPLSTARRRQARPRGARRAASAAAASSRRISSAGSRSCSRSIAAGHTVRRPSRPGSGRTRRSRATSSAVS